MTFAAVAAVVVQSVVLAMQPVLVEMLLLLLEGLILVPVHCR